MKRSTMHILLASERSKRDTIRGVQIRFGEVYMYILVVCSYNTEFRASKPNKLKIDYRLFVCVLYIDKLSLF